MHYLSEIPTTTPNIWIKVCGYSRRQRNLLMHNMPKLKLKSKVPPTRRMESLSREFETTKTSSESPQQCSVVVIPQSFVYH